MEDAGTTSSNPDDGANRAEAESEAEAEAERLLGIAEKLLQNRDFTGSREFAVLAHETEPLLEGPDQILAISDVFTAAEKRINNQYDWYSILGVERRADDSDLIKKNYRRLALLLHPDKNKFPHSDAAFKLVADAWAVLSDQAKKFLYDNELSLFSRVELGPKLAQTQEQAQFQQQNKLPVRRSPRGADGSGVTPNAVRYDGGAGGSSAGAGRSTARSISQISSFWTACPYCYVLYEYPREYVDFCLRCQNCQRAFHAAVVPSLPPRVPGRDAYYCCWGFFPLGFSISNSDAGKNTKPGFPNWMPPMFSGSMTAAVATSSATHDARQGRTGLVNFSHGSASAQIRRGGPAPPGTAPRKRGRPRKNPL
ncbi:hypothetical protein Nepgr_024272 [Nepenthes gracilis]|uniref:J domain-containing protein n=1 Tax=Nepenthes gracilis TaxID=150966 RepID=A0AAD3T4T6_NEPGR|nr:hypothetical protein Nepgr_024272 [Nepenthes gracilis]